MKRQSVIFLILFILIGFVSTRSVYAQDEKKKGEKEKIKAFEEEIEEEKDVEDDSEEEDGIGEELDDDTDYANPFFSRIFWEVSGRFLYSLFVAFPNEDSLLYYGDFGSIAFSAYPYAYPEDGFFTRATGKRLSMNFSGHYFYDEDNLTGYGIRGRFSPFPFFNLAVQYANLTEGLSTREDYLQLYSAFVNYYRIRIPSWVFWWGLGFKGLQGGTARHGFAFNLGIETYLAKPISIHLNYSGGWLNTTYVPEFFGTLNVHIRRLAIFAGYQSWSAGSARIEGILGGIQVYF